MNGDLAAALRDGVAALGLELNAGVEGQLLAYLDLLNRWNRVHNLTAIRDPAQQLSHHLLDCLSVLPHLPPGPLADIGSGAGLPGLIIALAEPQRPVYLVESSKKKCAFLHTAVAALGLKAVHIVAQRVEDWPGPVAVIISRALAELNLFLDLTAHLGDQHSTWLLMKAAKSESLQRPGFQLRSLPLTVPRLAEERQLLILRRDP